MIILWLFFDLAVDVTTKESESIDLLGCKIADTLQHEGVQKLVVGGLVERISEFVRGTPDKSVDVVFRIIIFNLVGIEVVDVRVRGRRRIGFTQR